MIAVVDNPEQLLLEVFRVLKPNGKIFILKKLADRVSTDHDPLIGKAKDLAAGAVVIISFFAVICALIIYISYLSSLF